MSIAPYLSQPAFPVQPGSPATPVFPNKYSVTFSTQFDDADKAMTFAKVMLQSMQDYGD